MLAPTSDKCQQAYFKTATTKAGHNDHAFNLSIEKAKAGESLCIQGQHALHRKF